MLNKKIQHEVFHSETRVDELTKEEVCFALVETKKRIAILDTSAEILKNTVVLLLGNKVVPDEVLIAEELEEVDSKAGRVPEETLLKEVSDILSLGHTITSTDTSNTKVLAHGLDDGEVSVIIEIAGHGLVVTSEVDERLIKDDVVHERKLTEELTKGGAINVRTIRVVRVDDHDVVDAV